MIALTQIEMFLKDHPGESAMPDTEVIHLAKRVAGENGLIEDRVVFGFLTEKGKSIFMDLILNDPRYTSVLREAIMEAPGPI
jgi:hypothetical protein